MNANASCRSSGCSDGAASRSTLQFNASDTWPALETKSKYARTVPANARAIPTEQMTRYFHDASTEPLVRCNGITTADEIVVASIATHISATFWTVTAASIVNANALKKIRNRRVCAGSSSTRPSPGPSADASSVTKVMHSARSADSPSNAAVDPAATTDNETAMAAKSEA